MVSWVISRKIIDLKKIKGDIQEGNKEKNVVSNKFDEDALIISLDNVDDVGV
jgi:hypothetical protein